MTIPKRREASHESDEMGGGIYKHRPAAKESPNTMRETSWKSWWSWSGISDRADVWKESAKPAINLIDLYPQMGAYPAQSIQADSLSSSTSTTKASPRPFINPHRALSFILFFSVTLQGGPSSRSASP